LDGEARFIAIIAPQLEYFKGFRSGDHCQKKEYKLAWGFVSNQFDATLWNF
jgi:hypothetical protein